MKIIAISGKKQSGKTTVVDFLIDKCNPCPEIICFADALKDIVCRCFGAKVEDLWGSDVDKCKILPCGKSSREILQIVGTDWFRSLDSECWIRPYKIRLETIGKYCDSILTPDVRFPNEVKCIQNLGGHVIRLLRAPFPEDEHKSETALDFMEKFTISYQNSLKERHTRLDDVFEITFDAIIDNREMSIDEQNEAVWKLVNERKWV